MCLCIIDPKCKTKNEFIIKYKRRAKGDIKVYKLVYKEKTGFRSIMRSFLYEKGYHYYNPGEIKPIRRGSTLLIKEALHSYSLSRALWMKMPRRYLIVECSIPKGSTYYLDEDCEEYASDNLIFTGKIIKRTGRGNKKSNICAYL